MKLLIGSIAVGVAALSFTASREWINQHIGMPLIGLLEPETAHHLAVRLCIARDWLPSSKEKDQEILVRSLLYANKV